MPAEEESLKSCRSLEGRSIGELARGIDGRSIVLVPPTTNAVIILQGKSQWIHFGMARGTHRVSAMRFHRFPHGQLSTLCPKLERWHIGGRRRGWSTQQIFEYPFPAQNYGGPIGVRCGRENTCLTE